MKEVQHLTHLLRETKKAIKSDNAFKLQHLSDQTIHSASIYQHTDYILTATIIYAISKLIIKKKHIEIKNWGELTRRINKQLSNAIRSLEKNDQESFIKNLEETKNVLLNFSIDLKPFILNVLEKASINKASKLYEHGISLGKTAEIFGLSQWELAEYIGQKHISEANYNKTLDIRRRIKKTMEFFA